ncbi:hypothetical protein [Oerskovia enterophila]|uniref:hypothetical protein n=1 Tax=Oerskovia enterophila TaxID=43678 RepID=UPI00339A20FD
MVNRPKNTSTAAETAPTSPKPATPADPNGLRTALTKAIDRADPPGRMHAGTPSISVSVLRTLLSSHPARETEHAHDWVHKEHLPGGFNRYRCASCSAEEVEPFPAPPVVDEAEVAIEARRLYPAPSGARRGGRSLAHAEWAAFIQGARFAARLRGAPRG